MEHVTKLKQLNACDNAIEFASKFNTFQEAWDACERSDWMIWIINKKGWLTDKELRLFAVRCARGIQHLMKDERSINAIDVAERYANGEATDDELDAAWAAARAAESTAAMAAESTAAMAAAWDAAWAAAWYSAWDAAWDAAWAAAWDAARAKQCDYIREILPNPNF
jgi:hypothetical protein